LAPLVDSRFAEYKTNNKVREYGACGIAGIYSDVPLYRESVEHGISGWLVPNEADAWVRAILAAVDDLPATKQAGRRAHAFVETHYRLEHVASLWREALAPTFAKRRARLEEIRRRCKEVHAWEQAPVDWPQIAGSQGLTKPAAPGEEQGFFRRDVLLMLQPGETLETGLVAPLAGPYLWGMLVGTFNATLTGMLKVSVWEGDSQLAAESHDMAQVADGTALGARCVVPASRNVRLIVSNESSGPVGLYGLSRMCVTRYPSTGASHPFGIAA